MENRKDNIVLIGFMGSGKSTVGIGLSYKLQRALLDTDKEIEKQEGKSVSAIFAEKGEASFREKETELLKKLKEERASRIFSVGGGTPLREENRKLLQELGVIIYLKVSPETVYERLKEDETRPLLRGENPMEKIRKLLYEREGVYRNAANIVVAADGKTPAQIVTEIVERLEKEGRKA